MSKPEKLTDAGSFSKAVGRLLVQFSSIDKGGAIISKGDVASLRRMDVGSPVAAFWKLLAAISDEHTPQNDKGWALVIKAMAIMSKAPPSADRVGRALALSGFSSSSDLRITRLLKADDSTFPDYALSAIRYLANKSVGVEWFSLSGFLFFQSDKERQKLAKDFYSVNKDA